MSFIVCLVVILSSGYVSLADPSSTRRPYKVLTVALSQSWWLTIFISLIVYTLSIGFIPLAVVFDLDAGELTWLILSATPVFLVGLAEDLGYGTSPKNVISCSFFKLSGNNFVQSLFTRLGVPGLDNLLIFSPFAILFTILQRLAS